MLYLLKIFKKFIRNNIIYYDRVSASIFSSKTYISPEHTVFNATSKVLAILDKSHLPYQTQDKL